MRYLFIFMLFILNENINGQATKKENIVQLSGTVQEKSSGTPLEFATVTCKSVTNPGFVTGGLTDEKGNFMIELPVDKYNISIEYISFNPYEKNEVNIVNNLNLGKIDMTTDAKLLNEVVVVTERTTVEMKLDKKVYNLGQDLMVKGGTASDVLDNVPSVAVDAEGSVSLRGNENVKILIDGRPTNATNINDVLRTIPAESLEKIEVITNPSSRYDAEGGAGIINIVLKKGKNNGVNGVFTGTVGSPSNNTLTANLNRKSSKANIYTMQSFRNTARFGTFRGDTDFLNPVTGVLDFSTNERRRFDRKDNGYNGNLGLDLFLGKKTTWSNMVQYRYNDQMSPIATTQYFLGQQRDTTKIVYRQNDGRDFRNFGEFTSKLTHKFDDLGKSLNVDVAISLNGEDSFIDILDVNKERNIINSSQRNQLYQLDYVHPFNENTKIEFGYRGSFLNNKRDFKYERLIEQSWVNQPFFTNDFEYVENINAIYTQFSEQIGAFNYMGGLRWEHSNIDVNLITESTYTPKVYHNFFPSLFLNYKLDDFSGLSLSYSRRVQRPRGRMLNPFSDISSNVNIFRGNPDLNPVFTDVVDFGWLKSWKLFSLNASAYINYSENVNQFFRRQSGLFLEDGTPVIFTGPINGGNEFRYGTEFTLNFNPTKKMRFNTNFNFYGSETIGSHTYTDLSGREVTVSLDNSAFTWFARLNSKITLPYKLDWQTNVTYNAPVKTFQGKVYGIAAANIAFSKDILKDKGTLSLNINDVFNSRRRIFEAMIPNVLDSYINMQWMVRQTTLAFTYRLNVKKSERDQNGKPREEFDGGMM